MPWNSHPRGSYACLLAVLGRVAESVAEARSASERDPTASLFTHILSLVLGEARRYDEEVATVQAGIEVDQNYSHFHMHLGYGLVHLGRSDEGVEALRRAAALDPDIPVTQSWLGWALGFTGRQQEARNVLADLERHRQKAYVGGTHLAWVCLGLGDHEQAISWLQVAADERDGMMPFLPTSSMFDPLRDDPRFQALLRRMNFPQQA